MNTQTHMLMGGVLFGGAQPRRIAAGMIGGLLPDLPQLAIVVGLRMAGVDSRVIFDKLYFSNWSQITNAIGHSFLLWSGLLALGLLAQRRAGVRQMSCLSIVAAAALTHSVVDFFCHREDAHMHFWPLSSWKFMSPISYYDPAHYGSYFAIFEAALGISMAGLLAWRLRKPWPCIGLAVLSLPYAVVPAYFILRY